MCKACFTYSSTYLNQANPAKPADHSSRHLDSQAPPSKNSSGSMSSVLSCIDDISSDTSPNLSKLNKCSQSSFSSLSSHCVAPAAGLGFPILSRHSRLRAHGGRPIGIRQRWRGHGCYSSTRQVATTTFTTTHYGHARLLALGTFAAANARKFLRLEEALYQGMKLLPRFPQAFLSEAGDCLDPEMIGF